MLSPIRRNHWKSAGSKLSEFLIFLHCFLISSRHIYIRYLNNVGSKNRYQWKTSVYNVHSKGAPPQQLKFLFQSSKHTCTKLTGSLKSPLSYARKISSIYWQKPTYMTILKSLTILNLGTILLFKILS